MYLDSGELLISNVRANRTVLTRLLELAANHNYEVLVTTAQGTSAPNYAVPTQLIEDSVNQYGVCIEEDGDNIKMSVGTDGVKAITDSGVTVFGDDDYIRVLVFDGIGEKGEQGDPGTTYVVYAQDWNSATSYAVGDVCHSSGTIYKCIAASTNNQPPNVTYWEAIPQTYTSENEPTAVDGALWFKGA